MSGLIGNRRVAHGALACVLLAVVGCGTKGPVPAPVSGTVTLDGKLIPNAAVMFVPQFSGQPAHGLTDQEGRFALGTLKKGDGAMEGKYQVTIILNEVQGFIADPKNKDVSGGIAPGGLKTKWIIPQKYSDTKTSGLAAEVKRGMEPLRFDLTSK